MGGRQGGADRGEQEGGGAVRCEMRVGDELRGALELRALRVFGHGPDSGIAIEIRRHEHEVERVRLSADAARELGRWLMREADATETTRR